MKCSKQFSHIGQQTVLEGKQTRADDSTSSLQGADEIEVAVSLSDGDGNWSSESQISKNWRTECQRGERSGRSSRALQRGPTGSGRVLVCTCV